MQNITILTIGKIKNNSLKKEIGDLLKRLPRIRIVELKEIKDKNEEIIKQKEFELIEPFLKKFEESYLLWEFGKEYLTKEFSNEISQKQCLFIVTGAFGPSQKLKDKVKISLSLSKMTFTHEQALYLLVEQLYRVQCIEKNIPYTK